MLENFDTVLRIDRDQITWIRIKENDLITFEISSEQLDFISPTLPNSVHHRTTTTNTAVTATTTITIIIIVVIGVVIIIVSSENNGENDVHMYVELLVGQEQA